ncbi:MAG: ECF transporter S component [Ruminococcus sp.]|nr:ECF transporter S component [Ruminococcus sp.]MCM1382077.1 ECF transporter S component [Muribaculaceae bacterium]MCM1479561.1 ECF transporter S component [Muribaculaceae bacterium]
MEKSVTNKTRTDTRKMVILAVMAALAYMVMVLIKIPVVLFLKYEPKDVIITISGFMFGPLASLATSAVVSLIEMVTVSDTGPIGALMNFIGTCSFACTAAVIYKKFHTIKGAFAGLCISTVLMTAVMLAWNYLVTPLYMGTPREVVAGMLLPAFLPFNLLKGVLNSALTMLIYKPLSNIMRKARVLPETQKENAAPVKKYAFVYVIAAFVIATCAAVIIILRTPKSGETPAETAKFTENYAEMWFDNYMEDYREQNSIELEEFPGVVFKSDGLNLTAEEGGEETVLCNGMPLWSVFLADLTGDGLPEFCCTISVGSGIIDDRIVVCDFAAGAEYELSDRFNSNYILTLEDGVLTVRQRDFSENGESGEVTGRLALRDGELVME